MTGRAEVDDRPVNRRNSILSRLFLSLPSVREAHRADSELHALLKQVARREVEDLFSDQDGKAREFDPFGVLVFPYHKMGAIDSLNLFDLDELIIFSFYWTNRGRYRRVLDIGANIGLHSIIMNKCGFDIHAYEPDPLHFKLLNRNLALNNCSKVRTSNTAVSAKSGEREFVRVLGNTTASHLAGSKSNPYGELERFTVKVDSIETLMDRADLIKIDVEGNEKEILLSTRREHWMNTDALIEVQDEDNAASIYDHFRKLKVSFFSQKTGWRKVLTVDDMPTSYHEGTLFATCKSEMPWGH